MKKDTPVIRKKNSIILKKVSFSLDIFQHVSIYRNMIATRDNNFSSKEWRWQGVQHICRRLL
jgi:hypothetical protein